METAQFLVQLKCMDLLEYYVVMRNDLLWTVFNVNDWKGIDKDYFGLGFTHFLNEKNKWCIVEILNEILSSKKISNKISTDFREIERKNNHQ